MITKFVYMLHKPRSNIYFFSVNTETVKQMLTEGFIVNCRRFKGVC